MGISVRQALHGVAVLPHATRNEEAEPPRHRTGVLCRNVRHDEPALPFRGVLENEVKKPCMDVKEQKSEQDVSSDVNVITQWMLA